MTHQVGSPVVVVGIARLATDHEKLLDERHGLPQVELTQETSDVAINIQHQLARSGHHRLPIPDLLIAAAVHAADLAFIHYDADFERIAKGTDVKHEWVSPAGSL